MAILAALSVVFGGSTTATQAAGSTPDLALAVDVNGGGDDCDTRASPGSIGTTCSVLDGGMFTLRGYVDSIAGLTDGDMDTATGYIVFQFRFLYTNAGISRNDRAGSGEVGSPTTYWGPSCSPNNETDLVGGMTSSYHVDCWGPGTESTYLGKLIEVDFTCNTPGLWTITMEDGNTYLHNDQHGNTPLDKETDETLVINCAGSVGGLAELPDAANAAPLATDGSTRDARSIAMAAFVAIASATGVLGATLLRRRARQRAG